MARRLKLGPDKASVVRLGLEPRLFWTKTRRVASYTTGQWLTARKARLNFEIGNREVAMSVAIGVDR